MQTVNLDSLKGICVNLLIINGSIHGSKGNCGLLISHLKKGYRSEHTIQVVHLKNKIKTQKTILGQIAWADSVIFMTGTYWDSWGSPLQKFFEDFTDLEATSEVVGKPAGVVVMCHSVGGKGIISRLQGNLNIFGFQIPPFCGMELSLVTQSLLANDQKNKHRKDLWHIDDVEIIIDNLNIASQQKNHYQSWEVDKKNFRKTWVKTKY